MNQPPQIVVVTGASGGIGTAVVRALAQRRAAHGDARVVALDRVDAALDDDLAEAERAGVLVRDRLDVADVAAVDRLFAILAREAVLRAVVHVAGVLRAGPALTTSPAEVRELFDVNALGTINVLSAAARVMCAQDASMLGTNVRSLTTVASNAGTVPRAGFAAYGASKAAAAAYTRSLGLELGPVGVRCNVVAPGTTRTPMVEALWGGADLTAETVAGDPGRFRPGVPLGRVAEPVDVADVVEMLVCERSRHVTLAELTVDGGATQR